LYLTDLRNGDLCKEEMETWLYIRRPKNDGKSQKGKEMFTKIKKLKKRILVPYIPNGLFQSKEEMCTKFGSDWFRNVNLCKV
jgi:hypothetical protein